MRNPHYDPNHWAVRWNRRFWIAAHNELLPYCLAERLNRFFTRFYP